MAGVSGQVFSLVLQAVLGYHKVHNPPEKYVGLIGRQAVPFFEMCLMV